MLAGWLWLAACLLLSAVSAGRPLWPGGGLPQRVPATEPAESLAFAAQKIETIRVGQRVFADNPQAAGRAQGTATAVDPSTWRLLRLRAEDRWADGTLDVIHVETLQPPEWVQRHGAEVGATVPLPLDLLEMGLPEDLRAQVVANDPCPPIAPGPGRVVLTAVNHLNPNVVELGLVDPQGRRETVRPTALHKFYSLSRVGWVSAEQLRHGEQLQGVHGPLTVISLRRLPGVHRAYNMTVEGEHVYHVSALGVLAHNNGCRQLLVPERVYTTTDSPVSLSRARGTFVTSADVTDEVRLLEHIRRNVPPAPRRPAGELPRYLTEIQVPPGSVLPDPTVPLVPGSPTGWLPPNAPARITRVWEIVENTADATITIRPIP